MENVVEYLVPALGVLGGLAALLNMVAPKTKNKVDDKVAAALGKVVGLLGKLVPGKKQ